MLNLTRQGQRLEQPVLEHGPRSLTFVQVKLDQPVMRNESESV